MGEQQAARYRGTRIERKVEIAAPAAAVWALLDDVGGWSGWNPLYAEACGSIGVGDAIELAVVLPGMKPQKARATVLEMLPARRSSTRRWRWAVWRAGPAISTSRPPRTVVPSPMAR
jgi:hypothetical protein